MLGTDYSPWLFESHFPQCLTNRLPQAGFFMATKPLIPKQERFCQEFLVDLDQTQAAIRAGYSKRSASNIGYKLMQETRIRRRIQILMNRRADRIEIDQDNVLQECAIVALSDIGELFTATGQLKPICEIPELTRRAIASVEVVTRNLSDGEGGVDIEYVHKIKLWDKLSGLDKLGKHLKLFDRAAETGADDIAQRVRARLASTLGLPTVPDDESDGAE